jgi:hypothetical protein
VNAGFKAVTLAVFLTLFGLLSLKARVLFERYQDYRQEKAIDATQEWEAFRQAFEVKK